MTAQPITVDTLEQFEDVPVIKDPGFGMFRFMRLRDLHTDGTYQRPVSPWRVRQIVYDYKAFLFQPLIIGDRSSKFYVIDGQHRLAAATQLRFTSVPCMVYSTRNASDEAKIFLWLNDKRRILSAPQKFRARLAFNDKSAVEVAAMLKEFKFDIVDYDKFGQTYPKDNEIFAIGSLEYIYSTNPKHLRDTLFVLRNAWEGRRAALNKRMIRGLGRFMDRGSQYGTKALSGKLAAFSPFDLIYTAEQMSHRDNITPTDAMAAVIGNVYEGLPPRQKERA